MAKRVSHVKRSRKVARKGRGGLAKMHEVGHKLHRKAKRSKTRRVGRKAKRGKKR